MAAYLIETDNRTTWINRDGQLVGRICPISAEVLGVNDERSNLIFIGEPSETFDAFCQAIKERYGIDVPDEAYPKHLTMKRDAMKTIAKGWSPDVE